MTSENITRTPVPQFDPQTGYLLLSDGCKNQVLFRFEWPYLYLLWRRGPKEEVPLHIGDLFRLVAPD